MNVAHEIELNVGMQNLQKAPDSIPQAHTLTHQQRQWQ